MLWFLFCFCGSSDGFHRLRNRKYFIFRFDDHHHNKIVAISVIGCVIRMNGVPPRAVRAAPAVTNFPDFTIIRDSSRRTFGYLWRNKGASHQVVVESWLSSSPDSATTNVPMQAAAVPAPRSAHERSVLPASLTSDLAKAACNGAGILNPIAGTTTQSGTM